MPSEVRITTNSKFSGSGPKNDEKIPGVEETLSSVIRAKPSSAVKNPPFDSSTAYITAEMPTSMTTP